MEGPSLDDPELQGITPRMLRDIFGRIQGHDPAHHYEVFASYIEVYKERIYDLLAGMYAPLLPVYFLLSAAGAVCGCVFLTSPWLMHSVQEQTLEASHGQVSRTVPACGTAGHRAKHRRGRQGPEAWKSKPRDGCHQFCGTCGGFC